MAHDGEFSERRQLPFPVCTITIRNGSAPLTIFCILFSFKARVNFKKTSCGKNGGGFGRLLMSIN